MDEGDRTLDRRNHNPELYQLSYAHHNFVVLCNSLYVTRLYVTRFLYLALFRCLSLTCTAIVLACKAF